MVAGSLVIVVLALILDGIFAFTQRALSLQR
jgi:ABC-type proline/glycine betaine transport system permease subunit